MPAVERSRRDNDEDLPEGDPSMEDNLTNFSDTPGRSGDDEGRDDEGGSGGGVGRLRAHAPDRRGQ